MRIYKLTATLSACWFVATASFGDTLTFVAQPVSGGGGIDHNWFTTANWFTTDTQGNLLPAGRVPLESESAIITGLVDINGSAVRVVTMVATNNAIITNGTVAVENLQLLSGSRVANAAINVLTFLDVGGTNCTLNGAILTLLSIGTGSFQPLAPANASTLILSNGSSFVIGGVLSLAANSQISGGGLPQSKLFIQTGATLSSVNSAMVRGSTNGHLVIDNSGVVRADSGTLTFVEGTDWQCSGGSQEFRASSAQAVILFSNVFHNNNAVTSFFTGPGTNRWQAAATIDGTAQVSALDSITQLAGPGNLEMFDSVTGAGTVHVLGTTNQGGASAWMNGTLAVAALTIDPGANLVISGGSGTSRQIAGCAVTNSGNTVLMNGDLSFSQAAVFNNEPGASFVVQADDTFSSADTGEIFNNSGTFQKLSPGTLQFASTNSTSGPAFNNSGLVDLENGQLNLSGGISPGEFRQGPGTLLWFWNGAHSITTGAKFTGSSIVRVSQGISPASFLVDDALTLPQLELGTNGLLDATGASNGTPISIGTLVAHDNGILSNGTFQVQSCQLLDQSDIAFCTVTVSSNLWVGGTNCLLSGTFLSLAPGAAGKLQSSGAGAGATLNLQGAVLQNGGQLTLGDGSVIAGQGAPSSKLIVQPGAVLVSTNSTMIQGPANAPLLIDNSGTVRVDGGILTFSDGLAFTASVGAGEFSAAAPNAMARFSGPFAISNSITTLFTGPGTNVLDGGAVIDGVAQAGGVGLVTLLPATGNLIIQAPVAGAGSIHALGGSTQGTVYWNNGPVSVAGVAIDQGASFVIGGGAGTSRQVSGCTINNSGSCIFLGAAVVFGQGAGINNLIPGTLQLQGNTALTLAPAAANVAFNNSGTCLQPIGGGTSVVTLDFNNSGTFEIQNGTVSFQGSWKQTQGVTVVDPGAFLSGTNLTVLGGMVTGSGTIGGNLINAGGQVNPGSGIGVLSTGPGDDYQQGASGSLAVELGGTAPGSQFDQLAVGGTAFLDGQLQVTFSNGFLPQRGQSFPVLTCRSQVGRFSGIAAPSVPGLVWVTRYSTTNVTVLLADSVTLTRPAVSGGTLTLPVNTTPGVDYVVQASDSLSPPNWQTIASFAGDGTIKTAGEPTNKPQRFYRVLLQ